MLKLVGSEKYFHRILIDAIQAYGNIKSQARCDVKFELTANSHFFGFIFKSFLEFYFFFIFLMTFPIMIIAINL